MRLVRAAGQNVSPSDDGRLYDQIFSDGLFTETSFASLGADSVRIGAMYGDLCGRDFTIEQQTITVQLPEGEGETTGYIYVEIDLSAETPLSVGSALAPFTPTYEDINVNGAVCQMIVAEYTATALAVTSVTAVYEKAAASSVKAGSIATVENSTATEAHDVGEYILLNGQMYIITAAVSIGETFIEGTNISAVSIGDELTSLNAGLTFKTLVTNATANTVVSLPSEYTELRILVRNSVTVATMTICKNEVDFRQSISSTELFINNVLMQGYSDAWGISADVLVENNTLKLVTAKQCVGSGGVNDVTSTARMTVFYR